MARPSIVSEQVARLCAWIEQQGLLPGSRLPPERTLAVSLGISSMVVRSCIERLEKQGVIATRSRKLRYVATEMAIGQPDVLILSGPFTQIRPGSSRRRHGAQRGCRSPTDQGRCALPPSESDGNR